ncbi:MAG TPA: AraC family transcriptional regulator [Planctomycetota bacterium]|nr:AraC family transcriptional regulator [Planctomycetota bacterium]
MAHQLCGSEWFCNRKSYPGHQIMFMMEGSGHGSYMGEPWQAAAGSAVLMDLTHPHTYYCHRHDPWEMRWIIFDGPGVDEMFQRVIDASGSPVAPFSSAAGVKRDFDAIFALLERRGIGDELWVWHHLTGLMANIFAGLAQREGALNIEERAPEGIAAALTLIRDQHRRAISLEELAKAAHMSVFHFARQFRRKTGFTPMEYVEKLRIARAQELLLGRSDLRLQEIAREVGYDDPAYFSRVFRKRAGVGPREYRNAHRGT